MTPDEIRAYVSWQEHASDTTRRALIGSRRCHPETVGYYGARADRI